jgi:uncharacterized protein
MRRFRISGKVLLLLTILVNVYVLSSAQSGDQILDGIGETGMVARYIFNGDLKDWSRNNLHGEAAGSDVKFVNDNRFGKVLSLSGESNAYLTIPADALTDLESLSISGWIMLRSQQPGQHLFDFGKDGVQHLYFTPAGNNGQEGTRAYLASSKERFASTAAPVTGLNKWVHIAIVFDVASKSLTTYIDSKPAGEAKNLSFELTDIFGLQTDEQKLYI